MNLSATVKFLREKNLENVLLVCAGTRENTALEDVLAAGAFCEELQEHETAATLSDSAQIALATFQQAKKDLFAAVCKSENAQRLLAIPGLRDDVKFLPATGRFQYRCRDEEL